MSNLCRIEGTVTIRHGATKEHIESALKPFFELLENTIVIEDIEDDGTELSFNDEQLYFLIETYGGMGGYRNEAMEALVTALNPLVDGPDWVEFVDMESPPSSEDTITPYFIGATEEDRKKARLLYGIAQMSIWIRPVIGSKAFDEVEKMILES